MATELNLKKGNVIKKGVVGFSWTTFCFGAFVPLFRGDWIYFLIILIVQFCTFELASIGFAFVYNKIYTRSLIEKEGFEPADDYSKQLLASSGIFQYQQ